MSTKHTPEPWDMDEAGRGTYMVFPSNDTESSTVIASGIKSLQDARLIAAAPELLGAVLFLLPIVQSIGEPCDDDEPGIVAARTAVTKATGKDQP